MNVVDNNDLMNVVENNDWINMVENNLMNVDGSLIGGVESVINSSEIGNCDNLIKDGQNNEINVTFKFIDIPNETIKHNITT